MLARIEGVLESVVEGRAVIAQPSLGVAREVMVPPYAIEWLAARIGQTVSLHTVEYLESQGQGASFLPRVLGFESADGRRLHELLTTIRGVGPRKALRIMAREPAWIGAAVLRNDVAALKTLPEVGPKLAHTIIADLADRAAALPGEGAAAAVAEARPARGALPAPGQDAVAALVALGQMRREAEEAVRRVLDREPGLGSADAIVAAAAAGGGGDGA